VVTPPASTPAGLTVVLPGDSVVTVGGTVVAVAARTDGTLVPAGTRVTWSSSQPDLVSVDSLGQVTALGEGSAALTARVGDQSASRTLSVRGFHALSVNTGSVCAVRADGKLFCWGGGGVAYGLGGGARTPTAVQSPARFTSVSIGLTHACAIDDQADLYCWGTEDHGQLGNGTQDGAVAAPTKVRWGTKYRAVAAGFFHTCALTLDGAIDCWGAFGTPNLATALAPLRLGAAEVPGPYAQLASTTSTTVCASNAAGATACWGDKGRTVRGVSLTGSLAAAGLSVCGASTAGDAVCLGTAVQYDTLVAPQTVMRDVGAVSTFPTGDGHGWCALDARGAATCASPEGFNGIGILGVGAAGADGSAVPPTPMGGALRFRALAFEQYSGCGLATTGRVYCWGKSGGGQLGGASSADVVRSPLPVPIP
jgi:hypothetical protein